MVRRRASNDNHRFKRQPFAGWLGIVIASVALWVLIVQGVVAVLKAIFG